MFDMKLKKIVEILDEIARIFFDRALKASEKQDYTEREAALQEIHIVLRVKGELLRIIDDIKRMIEKVQEVKQDET